MSAAALRACAALALVGPLVAATPAYASNGLTLIGTGAESVAMGGADAAVARDTNALSINPAGLGQLRDWAHDALVGVAFALDIAHADQFGNDRHISNWISPLIGAAVSRQLDGTGLTLGIGLFAQAGAGNVFNNLQTPFGGKDTLRAQFGVLKLTPGVAWQASEELALGATLNIYHASLVQRVFPNTSRADPTNPAQSFFGTEIEDASAVRFGFKAGLLYKPSATLALGLTYSPQVKIPFDNGVLIANLTSLGLGRVTYRDLNLTGLALPQEIAGGIAWQATPRLLLALDVMWSDYSRALRVQTLSASNPDHPLAPPAISNTSTLGWRDQTVVAAGFAYALDEPTRVYGGINYGRNPVPPSTLNPLLATIGERHLTAGFARRLDAEWSVTAALEYLLPKKVTYHNPELPFGPGAQERVSYVAVNVMLSRRW